MTEIFSPPYPDDTLSKGWRFELHTEKVKKSDTWLRARTGFVRAHLLLLWSEAWEQTPCGTLPHDDELIALLLDMDDETFAKHRSVLMRGWTLASNGRYYHETITDRVLVMLDKRMKDAQRSHNARERAKDKQASHPEVTGASRVTLEDVTREFDTKHQAPEPVPGTSNQKVPGSEVVGAEAGGDVAKATPTKGKRLPKDFVLPAKWGHWALEKFEGWTPDAIRVEGEKFKNHWVAKSGKDATKLDWYATWQNWMHNAKPPGVGGARRGHQTEAERALAAEESTREAERLLGIRPANDPAKTTKAIDAS